MDIAEASESDLGELFSLQRAAFVDEAVLYGTPHVPALDESFTEFQARHEAAKTLVVRNGARIIGAVSVRRYENLPDIERLMTVPDRRGEGVATALMAGAEELAASQGHLGIQLIVGELASDNQRLYERLGYRITSRWESTEFAGLILLRMTKHF